MYENHINRRNPWLLVPPGFAHITGAPREHHRRYDDSHPLNALRRTGLGNEIPPIAIEKGKSADKSRSNNEYVIAHQRNANG